MIDRTTLQFSLAWRLILLLVIVSIAVVAGLWWDVCQVSAGYESDLAHAVLLDFFADIVWALPVVAIATVAMGIWAIRSGLAPLRALSTEISRVTPGSRPACLAGRAFPGEVVPLVATLDKLSLVSIRLTKHNDILRRMPRMSCARRSRFCSPGWNGCRKAKRRVRCERTPRASRASLPSSWSSRASSPDRRRFREASSSRGWSPMWLPRWARWRTGEMSTWVCSRKYRR